MEVSSNTIAIIVIIFSLLFLIYSLYKRYLPLKNARRYKFEPKLKERFKGLLQFVFFQKRMFKDKYAGFYHLFIFYGFLIFSLKSLSLIFEGFGLNLNIQNLSIYQFSKDIFIFFVLFGIFLSIIRRFFFKPERLKNSLDAFIILVLIGILMITDGLSDGALISLRSPAYAKISPVSALISSFISKDIAKSVYIYSWWIHLFTLLFFMNYLPYSKHFHVYTSFFNVFLRKLEPAGKIEDIDLENITEDTTFGIKYAKDFNFKQILDFYTCTECGRCREFCPTKITGKDLSPMEFGISLRDYVYKENKNLLAEEADGEKIPLPKIPKETIKEEIIWDCTTCRFCEEQCPLFISYVDKIVDLRRNLVLEESDFPEEAINSFKGMEVNSNPWNMPKDQRCAWMEGLEVPIFRDKKEAEYLFWIGCAGSYDDHAKKISKVCINILNKLNINYAVLGEEEGCTGDSARRLGNEYLFQQLAIKNVEILNRYKFKKIITFCPHCLNTLKNEYPSLGGKYQVIHFIEFLSERFGAGELPIKNRLDLNLTYHDSCYLGRYNGIYYEPRFLLSKVLSKEVKEMELSKEKGFCCGAGGGRMWLEEKKGERINHKRFEMALKTGAEAIGVSCPFCYIMLENATKEEGKEDIKVYDLIELIWKTIS